VGEKTMYVYILTNAARMLYVGVTNDLSRRLNEHLSKTIEGYKDHDITRLAYFEEVAGPLAAIEREKQIKSWNRMKRIGLIESRNPQWRDLSGDWIRARRDP
jgi:putative endonuclease